MESLLPTLVNFLSVDEMVKDVALRIVFHTLLTPGTFTFSEFPPGLIEAEAEAAAVMVVAGWALAGPAALFRLRFGLGWNLDCDVRLHWHSW